MYYKFVLPTVFSVYFYIFVVLSKVNLVVVNLNRQKASLIVVITISLHPWYFFFIAYILVNRITINV